MVNFYKGGQRALKEGATLPDIRAMSVISSILKARMEVPDDQIAKLDQIDSLITEQFKNIMGVKVAT
jgi:V/A-type H+-transporting ATPase subunit A